MKRFLSVALLLFIWVGSACAYQNPFMDVPANHWAYDALMTLASKGIVSGYPDGLMKGKQAMTRYEVASAVARALVYIDTEKASQEEVSLLKRLCVEFADELEVLNVKVDKLGQDFDVLDKRLGGWEITGSIQVDANILPNDEDAPDETRIGLSEAKIGLKKYFGEPDGSYFFAELNGGQIGLNNNPIRFSKFYANINMEAGWRVWAGRFAMDFEGHEGAYFSTGRFGDFSQGAWFTDVDKDSFGFTKTFDNSFIHSFRGYVSGRDLNDATDNSTEIAGIATFKPSENITFDFGGDYSSIKNNTTPADLSSSMTFWVAPTFAFNDNIAIKGAYYLQKNKYNKEINFLGIENDSPKAYRVVLDIKQPLLKYTSLWGEYNKFDKNFIIGRGTESLILNDQSQRDFFLSSNLGGDLSVWRLGANQIWNDKWSTWAYFARYDYSNFPTESGRFAEPSMDEISFGIEYKHCDVSHFTLGYFYDKFNEDAFLPKKRSLVFRTSLFF